ncbi:hypothetical protein BD769DRAFT_1382513 [Suillus cothurnatus]|nr:hypothetical protein BD769DRAFT_1382513 [Suillus cothurnatus]
MIDSIPHTISTTTFHLVDVVNWRGVVLFETVKAVIVSNRLYTEVRMLKVFASMVANDLRYKKFEWYLDLIRNAEQQGKLELPTSKLQIIGVQVIHKNPWRIKSK